jgi:hypothetical protein
MLRDFVTYIATTNGASDCCQGTAVTAADTATHQAAHNGANTYAERTVLGNRSWLLIRGGWAVVAGLLSLGQPGAVTIGSGLAMTRIVMVNDRFVSNNLPHYRHRCRLLRQWDVSAVRYFCGRIRCGSTLGLGQKPGNRCGTDQADQGQGNRGSGHQWVDAIRASDSFHFRSPVWRGHRAVKPTTVDSPNGMYERCCRGKHT